MIVLHAIWNNSAPGKLHLWAESSALSATLPKRAGKQAEAQKPRLHPFVLTHDQLAETVGDVVGNLFADRADQDTLSLRLPSTPKGPLSSPELLLEQPIGDGQAIELRAWKLATLGLDAGTALDFLLALPASPPHGLAFGSSLRFWSTVANFAFEQITRQNFTPALSERRDGETVTYRANWEAVLLEEDVERLQLLARVMPPVCWSFASEDNQKASLLYDLVLQFLNQSIDAFVRGRLVTASLWPASRRTRPTLHQQWLHALVSSETALTGSSQELASFAKTLHAWLEQIRPSMIDAPFRTCFRLDPPVEKSEEAKETSTDWQISFHLQANDDRSLLVPAEKVWQERSGVLTFLKRKFENPQERLLADLGKAEHLFPTIEASLRTARPTGLTLNTGQAYQFLREAAPLLEESGFGVLIPPWWQKRSARVGVKLRVKPKGNGQAGAGLMGLESIVSYDWNIAIGETTLTLKEFEKLVGLKQPLVQIRGQWVELRPEEIEAAIAFFQKKRARKEMTLGEALRVGVGHETAEMGLPILDMEAEGWIKDVLDRLSQRVQLASIDVPTTFQGKLRPYQAKGLSWLAFLRQFGFGACLADDMGLGKTAQMIALLLYHRAIREPSLPSIPTLIICPMSIVGNWQREIQRFAPSLSVMVHHGHERLSGPDFEEEARKHDVVITTYALALRDKEHLASIVWDNVVVDEAQNIKNETAKQTQAIKSLEAQAKIALTGTPVENRLSELWSIMEFLNPGYLGSGTEFRKSFALPIERYRNAERAETLKNLIQPFVLRRVKTDKEIIKDLPDKMEMKVFCNLTQEQASLYEAVVREMMEKIEQAEGIARKGLVLATLMRLKQVCNHPAQYMGDSSSLPRRSGKLSRLEEMLEEVLAAGDKALIFTQFAEMGTLLRGYLQETLGRETLFLHGGVAKKQRDIMVQRFQEERKGVPLFILSLKAGGVGLNLTGANHVFHFDRWWNPAVENQATDRAFRIGQTKNVQVHKFVCVGTLEERIDQMIEQKKELAESIVGSGENWVTEMSTDQLKELFALSREAVGG